MYSRQIIEILYGPKERPLRVRLPRLGPGYSLPPLLHLVHSLPCLLLFITFSLFPFLIHFTYFSSVKIYSHILLYLV